MGDITIRGIDDAVLRALSERASAAGRSLEDEGRRLLEQAVTNHHQDFWERMRQRRASYGDRVFSDSTQILREMRDERTEQLGDP